MSISPRLCVAAAVLLTAIALACSLSRCLFSDAPPAPLVQLAPVPESKPTNDPLSAPPAAIQREASERPNAEAAVAVETPVAHELATAPSDAAAVLVEVLDEHGVARLDDGVRLELRWLTVPPREPSLLRYFLPTPEDAPREILLPAFELEKAFLRAREIARERPFEVVLAANTKIATCSEHVFEELAIPRETIRLHLQPGGRVRVNAVDAAGNSIARALSYRLRLAPLETALDDDRSFDRLPILVRETTGGTCLFEHVRCPFLIEALVVDPLGMLDDEHVRMLGPAAPGHEVQVTVQLADEAPRILGRLLDEELQPLRSRAIALDVKNRQSAAHSRITTDAEGRFSLGWTMLRRLLGTPEQLAFTTVEDPELRTLRMQAPAFPEHGALDLGDLVLRPLEAEALLAAGFLHDAAGQPIARASVDVVEVWPPTPNGPWEVARRLTLGHIESDAQGRFEIRSRETVRALHLTPRCRGYFAVSSIVVEPGTRDAHLELRRGGDLAGRIQADPGLNLRKLSLRLERDAEKPMLTRPDGAGAFRFDGLRPGRTSIRVELAGVALETIQDLEIREGVLNRDPRLDPLDLRDRLRAWRLRLQSSAGTSIAERRVALVPLPPRGDLAWGHSDREGRCTVLLPKEVVELRLFVAECNPAVLTWRDEEQTIALTNAARQHLRITGLDAVPEELETELQLGVPNGSDEEGMRHAAAGIAGGSRPVRQGSEVELFVPWSGTYELRWYLRSKVDGMRRELGVTPLELSAEGPARALEVGPSAQDVARALAELRTSSGR
ncbi:MAG: hypothetical protein JNM84_10660 [Planctomycetes bacterium]|nr:hypothetical protein [Planctomycetota bacterium]